MLSVPVSHVNGLQGTTAVLPCDVQSPSGWGDVFLILWFKDNATKPMYRWGKLIMWTLKHFQHEEFIHICHTKKSSPCVSVKNPHDGHEYQKGDAVHTRVWFQTVWQEYNLLNKRAIWSIDGSIELLGQQLKKEPFVLAFAKDGGQTTSFISTSWRYYAKLREFSTIGAT